MIIGLLQGFAEVPLDEIELTVVTFAGLNEWIRPYRSLRFVEVSLPSYFDRILYKRRVWAIRPHGGSYGVLPRRDRAIDKVGADVVHFPLQRGVRVRQPFIYQPHDLQHRHLPSFFSARQIASREVVYRSLCRRATAIAVGTSWVKADLVEEMKIDPEKIFVIPLAPVLAGERHVPTDLARLGLPDRFIIYPAASWAHKNHRRLFEALALLRRRGIEIPLVLTGPRSNALDLAAQASSAGVQDLIIDLGYRPQAEIEALTVGAVAMVVPTLFEAASFPVWEAFRLGTPVACSNVTSLPRQVGDCGILFDPHRAETIADAIWTLWEEPLRRKHLAELGRARVAEFSWHRAARQFLALYRFVGGLRLSDADRHLLESDPPL
jgi:glycosyltransferase involved in cell wall biosynthesis